MVKVRDFLGPYRLARLIRLGSTCQVWEGIKDDGNRYALKVLRPEQRGNKEEIGFLKHEFEIASNLHHKNIIKLVEYVTDADTPFIVLELFSEINLKQALRKGPEPIAYMLASIIEQISEALYYFHSKGYVHCDIKPDNILVNRDGLVKLIDFTIAKKAKTGLSKLFGGKSKVEGTRSYMSPEQIRGQGLDPRSDIYSLGCMFYEMLVGKPPFTGNTPNDLLSKHLTAAAPSVLVVNDNVTPEFNNVIRKMMSKKPEDRPQSMWDVLKIIRATPIFKKPPRKPDVSVFDDMPSAGRVDNPT
ncbi:Serine/threonine-protein kinase PknL [Pirellula sp. SH-Sr6A]|uniref:serine/threonine-protein kinase n=1 Tax=Pirellula sp. SH-Sr6A TaxID=1632865 RepID=UPI00078CE093|nr:serine/threonine-protein kinase [Pirellula sp. SH-Sr6A]AMV34165.1 Serine/threonine-protein kinase PknL [Pirellula sp. SH-Sr6A]